MQGFAQRDRPLRRALERGDFYDVFLLRDGRIALVMGDVSGKGLQAAVHTAMSKYMLRAYAYQNADPSYVLAQVSVRSARGDHTMILDAVFEAAIKARDGALRDDAAVLVIKALDETLSRDQAFGAKDSPGASPR